MFSKEMIEKAIGEILEVYDDFMEIEEFPVDTSSIESAVMSYNYFGEDTGWLNSTEEKLMIKIGDNNSYMIFEIKERENEILLKRFSPIHTIASKGIININLSRNINHLKIDDKIFKSSVKFIFQLLMEHRKEEKLETISAISSRANQISEFSSVPDGIAKFKIEIVDSKEELFYMVTYFLINVKNKRRMNVFENISEYMISPIFLKLYQELDKYESLEIRSGKPNHNFLNAKKYSELVKKYMF